MRRFRSWVTRVDRAALDVAIEKVSSEQALQHGKKISRYVTEPQNLTALGEDLLGKETRYTSTLSCSTDLMLLIYVSSTGASRISRYASDHKDNWDRGGTFRQTYIHSVFQHVRISYKTDRSIVSYVSGTRAQTDLTRYRMAHDI